MNIEHLKDEILAFWSWFAEKKDLYMDFEVNQEFLFTELKAQLNKFHPDLVFEFSRKDEMGRRELVLSADGVISAFPIVIEIVSAAPTLEGWKIVAFRQPRLNTTHIVYSDLTINLDEDVFFRPFRDNGRVGLELHIKGFYESAEWSNAVFVILDHILGEYDTEKNISFIDTVQLEQDSKRLLHPIKMLAQFVKDFRSENAN